jgi:hypothetical protein
VKTALKGQHPTMFFFCYTTYARHRKEGRKDEGKKKEEKKFE